MIDFLDPDYEDLLQMYNEAKEEDNANRQENRKRVCLLHVNIVLFNPSLGC